MSLNGKVIVGDPLIGNYPAEIDATDDGQSVDFDGYGSLVVAIQTIGGVGGTNPELDGKIQESPDGGSWFDVEGATFTRVVASNKSQAIVFNRTMRFLRHKSRCGRDKPHVRVDSLLHPVGSHRVHLHEWRAMRLREHKTSVGVGSHRSPTN